MYDISTGEIHTTGVTSRAVAPTAAGLTTVIGEVDAQRQYIVSGVVTDKPSMGISVNKTTAAENELVTMTNLPVGTRVDVDGTMVTVNDGVLDLTFDTLGVYKIQVKLFPYLDYEVMVRCN
jgi:hypothetical protein